MKKLTLVLVFLLCLSLTVSFGAKQKANDVELVSQSNGEIVLKCKLTSYNLKDVVTPKGPAKKVKAKDTATILEKGAPGLNKLVGSIAIPNHADMSIEVVDAKYKEFDNVDIAPSKGVLYRDKNPELVPYEYGSEYDVNAFYPEKLADLGDPYIIRTTRGVAVSFYPFQYNPVSKVLRVYKEITVKISESGAAGSNVLPASDPKHKDRDFEKVFSRHFLNYGNDTSRASYTPINDPFGNMLIVSYSSFMDEMAPFVTWKESIGYNVDLVDYSTIGSAAALKTYVANYYNTNGLVYLLIVGDHAQVPVSSTSAGDSDNNYGYIVGSDHYQDIFVGRFSAETGAQVTTQVDRTIHYERDVSSSAAFFKNCIGMGSSEGTGDDGEYDYEHINNIGTDCTGYGYTYNSCHQSGGSAATMSSLINAGAGTIFYCGHGTVSSWYTSSWQYTSTHVNALTNEWELPFNVNVACVNGDFRSNTCYSEVWQRATNNGNPTGAIANCGSTINQSWNPPMAAEDEMYDLLVADSVRTYGAFFVNGMFQMMDEYGTDGQNMTDTWVCFGDASVQLRTPGATSGPSGGTPDPPVANFTSNTTTVTVGGSVNFTDTSTNTPTSWSWTFNGGTPSSSTAQNPTITYNAAGSHTVSLIATNAGGNDTETKTNYITVTAPQPPVADFTASATTIEAGQSVTFSDLTTNGPTSWSWTFTGGTPSSSTAQNPTITYNTVGTYTVALTATNAVGNDTETKVDYITVTQPTVTYCSSEGSDYSYEWISNVTVGSMNNTSGAAGYTDFTSVTCNLTAGNSVNVSLTPDFSSSTYTEYWKIWIDYNKDGDFTDTGEEVYASAGSTTTVTGSFTVAAGASGVTRMRVTMKYAGTPTSCETFSYGEVEDYTVNITAGTINPPVAAFSGSPTTIDEGQTVSFTDSSTNNPTSWSWAFEGGTPATSTAQNPTVTYNTAGTYNVSLTVTNSAGNDIETKTNYITVNVVTITYCTSQGNNSSYEWISNVTVGSMNNTSGAAGYTDFTSITCNLTAGNSVNVSLTPDFSSTLYTEYWKIWIDYNKDGDFDDAGEEVFSGGGSQSTVTGSFTVPTSAAGQATRMRVSMKWNAWQTSSCESFSYGEVEDYTVNIQ